MFRDNWRFIHWSLYDTPDIPFDFNTPITSDLTLIAQWIVRHTVTFNPNGSNNYIGLNTQLIDDGNFARQPNTAPIKPWHTFKHWSVHGGCMDTPFEFNSTPISQDKILIAVWEYLGIAPVDFRGGNNSVSCSWELSEAGHLVFLAQEVNVGNTYLAWSNFVLVNDIYLNDLSDLWMMLMLEHWELFGV